MNRFAILMAPATLAAVLTVSLAGHAYAAEEPPPAPVWLEQNFALEAAILPGSQAAAEEPAFHFEGTGRVLKDGFKSELVVDGVTHACDFTGQLTDSVTHVTQYYCYLEPETAIRFLSESAIPASSDSMARSVEVLKNYLSQDDLRSLVILIGADSTNEAFAKQTARYREPAAARRTLEVRVELAPN